MSAGPGSSLYTSRESTRGQVCGRGIGARSEKSIKSAAWVIEARLAIKAATYLPPRILPLTPRRGMGEKEGYKRRRDRV